ncbi:hypothetical protein [Actinomadura rugatobispora]|uniref:DUF559 domain-containing protein n=1 Tax=Actinomadura rugatobispora TaxID=1994 RepID=A0ABW0ZWV5_9ACTN|nr:hypothetical protein GCM10010200_006780 [Actinomadura rugatobispora]
MTTTNLSWRFAGTTVGPLDHDQATSTAARAALIGRLRPPKVVARRTAAWIWGLDVLPPGPPEPDREIDMTSGEDLPPSHIVEEAGVRLTSVSRTALDCARWLPRLEAIAALDQFLRAGVEPATLKRMAQDLKGLPHSSRLCEMLRLGDPGAASPGESWTRFVLVDTGFPRPQTQIPVMGPRGDPFYIDLGYEEFRVGMEYDGEPHHIGPRARARDEGRRRWLARQKGWEIIPVTRDFLPRPGPYLEALLTALLHRGWNPNDKTMDRIADRLARLHRGLGSNG